MTLFFTSDQHYFHSKILQHSHRPYATLEEMHEGLIDNWNRKVTDKDIGYILGDFSFGKPQDTIKLIKRMNGAQIHLIMGNHDKKMKDFVKQEFDSCQHYLEIKVPDADVERGGKQNIVLFHFPIMSFNKMHHGSFQLHGHCHGTLKDQTGKRLDVGVDVHDYSPISYEQIKEIMKTKTMVATDRHGDREEEE